MRNLLDIIEARSGLRLIPVNVKTRTEYFEKIKNHECDIVLDMLGDRSFAENSGYVISPQYMDAMVVKLSRKDSVGNKDIAVTLKFDTRSMRMLAHDPGIKNITVYNSLAETVRAVQSGKNDCAYLFSESAQCAVLDDPNGMLMLDPIGFAAPQSVAVNRKSDHFLLTVLTKAVLSISPNEMAQSTLIDEIRRARGFSVREWMNRHPQTVFSVSLGVLVFFGTCLVIVLISRRKTKKAYAELRKNSRMWKLLIDSLPIHIFAKDVMHNSRYIFNNRARCEFYRLQDKNLDGITDFDLFPWDFAKERRAHDLQVVKTPGVKVGELLPMKNAEGQIRQLQTDQIAFLDADGTTLLLGCSVDITDIENTRSEARENAEWFKKTLISIGDGVMTTDSRGVITLLNPVAERLLGVTLNEAQGKNHEEVFKIVSGVDGTSVPSPVTKTLATGEIIELANHTDLIAKNGKRYHVADSAAPILGDDGKIVGAILVFRDVTKEYELREKLQENAVHLREALVLAEAASKAKGAFLSQMSHEIRTPLNAVIGYLNIARESEQDLGKVDDCLAKGLSASRHLLSIINDILDVSSIESGKMKIANEDFDFKHLLTGIVSMFYNQAHEKGVNFEMNLRSFTEEWLVGDALRVNQILMNLLSNAVKFTPSGGSIVMTVKQLGIVQNKVQLLIQVSDTGCGMSEEYKQRLFTPFEQQDATTARKFGGTGLGLSITKNLVSLMHGTIEVESKENAGTTFSVRLAFAQSSNNVQASDADFSKIRALVVDDSAEDLEYMQMVLTKCGVKSDTADSGESAIAQLERRANSRHPYDICLLDLKLPGIDGIETARKIREMECCRDLPVILVTAYDVTAVAPEARQAGVSKVISKPLFQSTFFDFLMTTYYQIQGKVTLSESVAALKGVKILLVEDNTMNMDISTQYLTKNGMEVTQAWNGKEAFELFEKSPAGTFQIILMDIQMPVMDGYEATAKIRASAHPEAKTIPIIAMTANAFSEDVVKALNAGMNDHISKPISFEQLFAALNKEKMLLRVERRFAEIAERYSQKILDWDVINEVLTWLPEYQRMPPEHLYNVFKLAEKYFPRAATLNYNEQPVPSWHENNGKYSPLVTLVQSLRAQGLKVDSTGLQFHIFEPEIEKLINVNNWWFFFNSAHILKIMDNFAEIGMKINISEITIPLFIHDGIDGEELQAQAAEKLYRLWFSHEMNTGIIYWNYVDGTAAYGKAGSDCGENRPRGGFLNYDLSPKKIHTAIRRLIKEEWTTDETVKYEPGRINKFHGYYGDYNVKIKTDSGEYTRTLSLAKKGYNKFPLILGDTQK